MRKEYVYIKKSVIKVMLATSYMVTGAFFIRLNEIGNLNFNKSDRAVTPQ